MYAQQTTVPVEKSRAEVERMLARAGSEGFRLTVMGDFSMIEFHRKGCAFRMVLPLPNQDSFRKTPGGRRERGLDDMMRAWEQACRSRWRALALIIKAKLEAVDLGITSVEKEFAPDMVMGDGRTVYEQMLAAIKSGTAPKTLPFFGEIKA